MRKIFFVLGFLFSFLFLLPSRSFAVDLCPAGQFDALCKLQLTDKNPIIWNVVNILIVIAAILSLFFLIWGGIKWITSGGDKTKVDEARKTLTAAIIGLIITLLAFFIITLIASLFGIERGALFTLPRLIN